MLQQNPPSQQQHGVLSLALLPLQLQGALLLALFLLLLGQQQQLFKGWNPSTKSQLILQGVSLLQLLLATAAAAAAAAASLSLLLDAAAAAPLQLLLSSFGSWRPQAGDEGQHGELLLLLLLLLLQQQRQRFCLLLLLL